jgi:hypothetical protein
MRLACLCGNIEINWDVQKQEFIARTCACDYCKKMRGEYVSDSDSRFSFRVKSPAKYKVVQHGHKTAIFHECTNCGLACVTCTIKGQGYGIINAKVMGLNYRNIDSVSRDYSNETPSDRLARRRDNWCKVKSS